MKVSEKIRLATGLIEKSTKSTQKIENIARELNTTPHFLQQISGQLRKSGLIETIHGPGGGVKQPDDRTTCSLFDVYQALGSSAEASEDPVQNRVNEFLKNYTINYNTSVDSVVPIPTNN